MTQPGENTKVNTKEPIRFTEEQERVIDARGKSLLVSAAAGSGKTAVLVARILSLITDPDHPVDVDELLVVTFTNAAAAEMRERVLNALTDLAEEHPEDQRLQRQISLVHNAQITTVDSFCLDVVSNHFERIGLEPGLRIAEEGELLLMREDVCDAVLEDGYAQKEDDFLRFVNGYGGAKNDKKIREMIFSLYDYSRSYPWPDAWLDECAAQYDAASMEELEEKEWVREYLAYCHETALELSAQLARILALAKEPDGPQAYTDVLEDDLDQLETLKSCATYEQWKRALMRISFQKLPPARGAALSEEKKNEVQKTRNKIRDRVKSFREKDFSSEPEDLLDTLRETGRMVRTLVGLTETFADRFAQEKAKKNILDFSDLEHFALQILVDRTTRQPTATAAEYRQRFKEVMIDEYQDSNYLQEEILTAVSGLPEGRENLFMVGDVKQSIYRFRLARPELFVSKYETYSMEDDPKQRIDLHQNFRSCPQILSFVNDLFARIMAADLGNIEYDTDAALYHGRKEEQEETAAAGPECILIEPVEGEEKKFTEACVIARRIRRMIEEEELPGIRYRDVAILLRTVKGWASDFVKAFEQEGVPLLVSSQTGYFSAQEVQVILSMLRVLDNPRQDIPMAALLRSPIGGFTDEELARIKASDPDRPFFASVLEAEAKEGEEDGTPDDAFREKLHHFLMLLSDFRSRIPYTPIHTLIQQILSETGYRDFVTALPAGEQRRANLDMLLEKAVSYEKTSYHGLSDFVRYIDRLIKYDVDIGEAETLSDQENAVRLLTIHKSKGLEYPVVVLAGMGKEFNMTDAASDMIFHDRFGIGLKFVSPEKRTKKDTFIRRAFSVEAKKENLGEELRILYVAMTRAREKLILTGMGQETAMLSSPEMEPYQKLDFSARMDAKNAWDWVIPALSTYGDTYPLLCAGEAATAGEEVLHDVRTMQRKEALLEELVDVDEAVLAGLDECFTWAYPYTSGDFKQKVSVSDIKHRAMKEALREFGEEEETELFPDEIPRPYIPKFVKAPDENAGALRGTAFHRLLECLDFRAFPIGADRKDQEDWIRGFMEDLCAEGRMEEADLAFVEPASILRFLASPLGSRMHCAAAEGTLTREQPFVMSVAADRVYDGADPDQTVLVQGILDAFWEEEDGLVLLDYKTDRVTKPEDLILRYRAQLMLYAEALARRFDEKNIKEVLIYSFCLDQLIPVIEGGKS